MNTTMQTVPHRTQWKGKTMRHLLTLFDLSIAEINEIFSMSEQLKTKLLAGERESLHPNVVLGMLFEKQSLRTRVSFEAGITHLGGNAIFLGQEAGWGGKRESIEDFGRVLSQYIDLLVFRGKSHKQFVDCLLYTSPSPRDATLSRMPSSA